MDLYLELCSKKDRDFLYEIANDYETRLNSFNSNLINYDQHCEWFEKSLNDKNRIMYILKIGELGIGTIRLDFEHVKAKAIISYAIKKEFRGNGYANKILNLIQFEAKKEKEIKILEGMVKKNNIASIKAFLKNNFKEYDEGKFYRYTLYLK